MLKSYFIIALRNLTKGKIYSFIKIAGLALGLAVSMIIYLYVAEDLSYDTFHSRYRRIVRVLTTDSAEGVSSKRLGVSQPQLGPAAEEELPEVETSVRITGGGRYDLSYEGTPLECETPSASTQLFLKSLISRLLRESGGAYSISPVQSLSQDRLPGGSLEMRLRWARHSSSTRRWI